MTLLEVTDLTVEYSSGGYKVRPLNDFTLHVDKRELTVLLGASGCGKSTLLSAIAGLLRPLSGSIRVDNAEVVGLGNRALTRYRQTSVGVVFQAFNLIPSLTACENIEIICRTAGQSRTAGRERAEHLLEMMDLVNRMNHRPGSMSGGQQQRVAIARALVNDPVIIFADEPTGNLDSRTSFEVIDIFQKLNEKGITIVLVTHEPDIAQFATRKVVFKDGKIIDDSPVKDRKEASEELAKLPPLDDIDNEALVIKNDKTQNRQ